LNFWPVFSQEGDEGWGQLLGEDFLLQLVVVDVLQVIHHHLREIGVGTSKIQVIEHCDVQYTLSKVPLLNEFQCKMRLIMGGKVASSAIVHTLIAAMDTALLECSRRGPTRSMISSASLASGMYLKAGRGV
jgi:hypothetical protein